MVLLVGAVILPSQLPNPHHSVYYIVNIKQFMDFLYLIFYVCLRLQFLDVENNLGPRRPVPAVYRLLCSNVRGLAGNLSDLTVASSRYDILMCSETLVSICVTCWSCWFADLVALYCCAGAGCLGPGGWRHPYKMEMEPFANPSLSVVVVKR